MEEIEYHCNFILCNNIFLFYYLIVLFHFHILTLAFYIKIITKLTRIVCICILCSGIAVTKSNSHYRKKKTLGIIIEYLQGRRAHP